MARLVINSSDDELPSLASVLKSRSQRTREPISKKARSQVEQTLERSRKHEKTPDEGDENSRERSKSPELAVPKSVVRRRILKPITDNPLLLPISSARKDIEAKKSRTKTMQTQGTIGSKKFTEGFEAREPIARQKSSKTTGISSDDDVFFDAISTQPRSKVSDKDTAPKIKSLAVPKPSESKVTSMENGKSKRESSDCNDVFRDYTTAVSKNFKEASIFNRESPRKSARTQAKIATEKEYVLRIRNRNTAYQAPDISAPEYSPDESSGMSDFIVADDESIFEYSGDEDDLIISSPPVMPKSARKLVQGRRPERKASIDDDSFLQEIEKLDLESVIGDMKNPGDLPSKTKIQKDTQTKSHIFGSKIQGSNEPSVPKQQISLPPNKDTLRKENPRSVPSSFEHISAILEFSPPRSKSPTKLRSPTKPRKPASPSPCKPTKPASQDPASATNGASGELNQTSLKAAKDKKQKSYKAAFDLLKNDIATSFLKDLDDLVTGGRLSQLLQATGGIGLIWTPRLLSTAGRAFFSRDRNGISKGWIELAEKVLDDESRLLNTLAHEFCHLAVFLIDGKPKENHGTSFYAWARKVEVRGNKSGADGLLPRHWERERQRERRTPANQAGFRSRFGYPQTVIKIQTCHSFQIDYKYEWNCTGPGCAIVYKRHSKSINTIKSRCGRCRSVLVQTKPVLKASAAPSQYQQYMKANMASIKADNPSLPQKEIMALIAQGWKAHKLGSGTAATTIDVVPLPAFRPSSILSLGDVGFGTSSEDGDVGLAYDSSPVESSSSRPSRESSLSSDLDLSSSRGEGRVGYIDLTEDVVA